MHVRNLSCLTTYTPVYWIHTRTVVFSMAMVFTALNNFPQIVLLVHARLLNWQIYSLCKCTIFLSNCVSDQAHTHVDACTRVSAYRIYAFSRICNVSMLLEERKRRKAMKQRREGRGLFLCWLLNVPATCECISGMDLLRQFYVLPHWDRSCGSNFPSHPVTAYWNWANQSQHWPYNARRLAEWLLECQFWSHWYDSTPVKSRDLNPRSSALWVDAVTTRPTRRSEGRGITLQS